MFNQSLTEFCLARMAAAAGGFSTTAVAAVVLLTPLRTPLITLLRTPLVTPLDVLQVAGAQRGNIAQYLGCQMNVWSSTDNRWKNVRTADPGFTRTTVEGTWTLKMVVGHAKSVRILH